MSKSVQATPKYGDLRRRVLFLLAALIVYRIGALVPVPGINPDILSNVDTFGSGILGMLDMFTGGALNKASVFALGIMPYITSSIVVQLLTAVTPQLEALKKEGESGRKKITQYTRYGTILIAVVQSFILASFLLNFEGITALPGPFFIAMVVITITAGTMFLMWLGEQITERGIGNGISILIFAGIVVTLPRTIGDIYTVSQSAPLTGLIIVVFAVLVTAFVVFVERGQRRVLVNYAKRQVGNRLYGGQSSHVPLKLNMSGVMPAIFASSLVMFLISILGFLGAGENVVSEWFREFSFKMAPGQPLYLAVFAFLIIFFCYFYTALVFNPKDIAENLKKSGAFVPGIRPGQQTANYFERVMMRLTLVGAIYITLVCLLPEVSRAIIPQANISFGGTSLLIVVVVTMDFMSQVQANVMSYQYESLLKKTNFKGNMFSR